MERKNNLSACIYCDGETGRNKKIRRRLRDTRQNRAREVGLYRYLTTVYQKEGK